jgi:hypothetical protein
METPKFNISKITIPDLEKGFQSPKINQETLDKINEGIEEQHRQSDRKYRLEIGLVIIGLFLAGYSTYLTYIGNQNSRQIEKQEQKILTLEKEIIDLKTTLKTRDNEVIKLRQTLDSMKVSLTKAVEKK